MTARAPRIRPWGRVALVSIGSLTGVNHAARRRRLPRVRLLHHGAAARGVSRGTRAAACRQRGALYGADAGPSTAGEVVDPGDPAARHGLRALGRHAGPLRPGPARDPAAGVRPGTLDREAPSQ